MLDNKEPLIEPFDYHGPGVCPNCRIPFILADSEINILDLDPNGVGTPIDSSIHCRAMCPNCRQEQEMMRLNGIYVPHSETVQFLNKLEIEYEINRRKTEGKSVSGNPLVDTN